jgi:hypothetical protein
VGKAEEYSNPRLFHSLNLLLTAEYGVATGKEKLLEYGEENRKPNERNKMKQASGWMTNKYQLLIEEKRQLIKYASKYGYLPPGNKMFK